MSEGHYSVIRCIPDPARGETFNIGVVVWRRGEYRVAIDPLAAKRAARENPRLAHGALLGLEASIHSQMRKLGKLNLTTFERMRNNHSGIPYIFSEALFADIPDIDFGALEQTLTRLMERVVRPRLIGHQPQVADPAASLETLLWELIRTRQVEKDHQIVGAKTGKQRRVDYFANSGANAALDVLRLDVKSEQAIDERADAEAFKILDVTDENRLAYFYHVFCVFSKKREKQAVNERARQSIQSVRAKIITDIQEAAHVIQAAAASHSG